MFKILKIGVTIFCDLISPFLDVIDQNSFGLVLSDSSFILLKVKQTFTETEHRVRDILISFLDLWETRFHAFCVDFYFPATLNTKKAHLPYSICI